VLLASPHPHDVPFSQYGTNDLTIAAANSLSDNYSDFRGPKEEVNGRQRVTPRTLFRVNTSGDLTGPYVSQFLLQPFWLGALKVEQCYRTTAEGLDLPMAFSEGAPLHPAYPSGHATYGGAGVTVLKAIFNEDFEIPNPVFANEDGTKLLSYSGKLTSSSA